MPSTQRGEFANQKAVSDYAEAHDLAYVWEGTPAFTKRWRLAQLSRPGAYELVDVRTRRGMTKALLFSKAILQAEFEATAPLREALAIKRERLLAKRAAKEKDAAERASKQHFWRARKRNAEGPIPGIAYPGRADV
jgi:hypothetical protein